MSIKKKIKDLTLSELEKIRKKNKSCGGCPLWNLLNKEVCLSCKIEEWLGLTERDEIEVEEPTFYELLKEKNNEMNLKEMNGKEAFEQLKKNVEAYEFDKEHGKDTMDELTFKCMCVYHLCIKIQSNWLDLNTEEREEFMRIKAKYF